MSDLLLEHESADLFNSVYNHTLIVLKLTNNSALNDCFRDCFSLLNVEMEASDENLKQYILLTKVYVSSLERLKS